MGREPEPPGTSNQEGGGSSVSDHGNHNRPHMGGWPILSAATVLGPQLNKKVAAIALPSISLMNSTVPALIFRSFITAGDHHIISTYRRENLRKNHVIGLSFSLATLKCSCKESILLLQRKGQPISYIFPRGRLFVISDQCFPPAFPVADHSAGDCIAVFRIEHGNLYKLFDLFMRLVNIVKILQGSIILISSVFSSGNGQLRHLRGQHG
jgi:hypothetical protein